MATVIERGGSGFNRHCPNEFTALRSPCTCCFDWGIMPHIRVLDCVRQAIRADERIG
jgi:hypothetical protein